MTLPTLSTGSVTCVTSVTPPIEEGQTVTDVTDVTIPERGDDRDPSPHITEHTPPCNAVLREGIGCIFPPEPSTENHSDLVGPCADLLQQYGLSPEITLSNHVLAYQPDSLCCVKGCDREPNWKNGNPDHNPLPLCNQHFDSLRNALMQTEQEHAPAM